MENNYKTQLEMARELGVSKETIRRFCRNEGVELKRQGRYLKLSLTSQEFVRENLRVQRKHATEKAEIAQNFSAEISALGERITAVEEFIEKLRKL
jgi:DeoR/GlpR family transcriptional regulator of sugar metabolism